MAKPFTIANLSQRIISMLPDEDDEGGDCDADEAVRHTEMSEEAEGRQRCGATEHC